jgi:hypothetical protein
LEGYMSQKQTKAQAADTTTTDTDEAEYQAAVKEGKAIVADVSGKQWALGDLALKVEKKYGENRLEQFVVDINFPGAACTLGRYRSVCLAFPKTGGRPRFFASAQILQSYDDRIQIVTANPNISVPEAREIMRKWRAEHPDEDHPDVGQAEEDDQIVEEEADTAPTPEAATSTDKEQENEWSADNRAWERDLDVTLNNLKRVFAFRKRCTAEQWQQLVLDVEPSLGARVRHVSEEGLEVADALDDPLRQEADALTETGRVKTTPAPRASTPVQPSAGASA